MNAAPEWIYLKQQFIRRLQMSDKNFLGALTCSTFLLVLTMHTAHTAHLSSGHQMHRLLIWDQQRGTRHLLCPPSPMPPSQHQPSRRENISRLFVENIFEDPPEICYTKGHFVFIGPFGTVRIMKCFNFTHFSAAIFSGSLLSPSGE